MIPPSQSLLLSSYPRAKAGTALAMWGMTTLVAPVAGPLLGGWITDQLAWPWIFYINIPVGLGAALVTWSLYKTRESPTRKLPIDKVGLVVRGDRNSGGEGKRVAGCVRRGVWRGSENKQG